MSPSPYWGSLVDKMEDVSVSEAYPPVDHATTLVAPSVMSVTVVFRLLPSDRECCKTVDKFMVGTTVCACVISPGVDDILPVVVLASRIVVPAVTAEDALSSGILPIAVVTCVLVSSDVGEMVEGEIEGDDEADEVGGPAV